MTSADAGRPGETRKPRDDEIDVWGVTHIGNVRKTNQDHFLLATVNKSVRMLQTSLPDRARLPFGDQRLAFLAMVADGVGGGEGGEKASAAALEVVTRYVVSSMDCYYRAESAEASFIEDLQAAALHTHDAVLEQGKAAGATRTMATTLTLWMGVWPESYLLQVGDSRYYCYRDGKLSQVSRDQTLAQELVDQGVFTRAVGERSRFAHVLSSAIGGEQTMPVVTRVLNDWGVVHLLCSDGLTKHVSDERIAERLAAMTTAQQVCEQLVQDALDDGGSDNVTIIVGRSLKKEPPA